MEYTDEQIAEIKSRYRDQIYQGMSYSINKFDDQVLLISTGALVLSLNFIGDVVTLQAATWLWSLYGSWILFVLTSIVSVFTHLDSYRLHGKQMDRLDANLPLVELDKKTTLRNYAMFIGLSAGIILQVLFVIINVQNMKNNSNTTNSNGGNTNQISSITTIRVPGFEGAETLGAPVMQLPAALRPSSGQSTSGTKK
jgi:hypothetical protein